MDALPSLPSLTPDSRFWRVDWFGDCGYPGHIPRYGQPSIRVVLSPLRCGDLTAPISITSARLGHG